MLYEILKTSKLGASFAPDMYTALWAQKLARDGEVKTLSGAPPLSFKANGQPLLDYLISGNTVQSGTPVPDTPIMPQGTGERTGNLFDKSKRTNNSRVVYTTGEIGALSGAFVSDFTSIEPNTTYTLNIVSSISGKTGHLFALYDENKNFVNTGAHEATTATVYTFTTPSNVAYIRFNGNMASVDEIVLNSGSTPLPYENFGYKIPISSASTTTPVYLGEAQTTRKIKKLVLTGEEEQIYNNPAIKTSNAFYITRANYLDGTLQGFCTHYPTVSQTSAVEGIYFGRNISIFTKLSDGLDTVAKLKAYLAAQYAAGTPVTIWYVLANEESTVVNEPLMRIGSYADTVSYEQAGVEIPTARGTNTLDVLTDVKPSEIYIKYKS